MLTEIQRASFMRPRSVSGLLRKRTMKSSVMTREEEFIPDDRLDMAAARTAAMITPVMPAGRPTITKRGNRRSAPVTRLADSVNNSGCAVK